MVHLDLDALVMMADTAVPRRVDQRLLSNALREGHFSVECSSKLPELHYTRKGTIMPFNLLRDRRAYSVRRSSDAYGV